jgi:hypothetical protein
MIFHFEGIVEVYEINFNYKKYSMFIQALEPHEDEIILIPEKFKICARQKNLY